MNRLTLRARNDILQGFARWQLWGLLGWRDVRRRYRRTLLGPFWLTLNMGLFITAMGFLFGRLFQVEHGVYFPFLAAGFVIWATISAYLTDCCIAFTSADRILKNRRVPLMLFVIRIVWRHLIVFGHNLAVYVVVAVIFSVHLTSSTLLIVPALMLVLINALWIGLLLALLNTRFPDVQQLVTAVIGIVFFVTPVLWPPNLLGKHAILVEANPLYHMVELIRAPLLGTAPTPLTWLVAGTLAIVGWTCTWHLFARHGHRIAFYL
jgi:ABC-type polysaccharide/polyol phosphate export permease